MRITGGDLKGRRIVVPAGRSLRPSADKTREALFSILGYDIVGAKVADLFCGSGALGIEAVSRGADHVLFVDSSRAAIANVKKNLDILDIRRMADLKIMDVLKIRPAMLRDRHVLLADPPYGKGLGGKLISLLCLPKFEWYGILALEHEPEWNYDGAGMEILKKKSYGDMAISFFRKKVDLKPLG
jgi:16S rRNA (guanine966-N2)-methyltransferase